MIRDIVIIISGIGILSYIMYQQIKAIWRSREMIKIMQNPADFIKQNKEVLEKLNQKKEVKDTKDNNIGYI